MNFSRKIISFLAIAALSINFTAVAQQPADGGGAEAAEPARLFDYPVPPDTMTTLENRASYIVQHFWDNYNFSAPVRQTAVFEATFRDYIDLMMYSHRTIVISSIKEMMRKAQSNKSTFLYIADVAEQSLYAPGAEYWSDDVYTAFLESIMDNNMLKKEEKERYKTQLQLLQANKMGGTIQDIELRMVDGSKKKLSQLLGGNLTFVVLTDEQSTDCMMARLRLSTDVTLNRLIDAGELTVVYVFLGKFSDDWASRAATYNDKWHTGASDEAASRLDLRRQPSIYILDPNGKILDKNISAEGVLRYGSR